LVEQLDYNLLFRWFVGPGMDDAVWNHSVFSKNRDRLLNSEVAQQFFAAVNQQAKRFMSDDHFTVDGTLIQAWASHKSVRAKDGSDNDGGDGANFHGTKRSNDTHESTTDPDARLYKKSYGKELHLAYLGHTLVENSNGLITAAMVTQADGYAEREAALLMLQDRRKGRRRRIAVGADKAYDTKDFIAATRALDVTFDAAARALKLPREEIEELSVPDCGLGSVGLCEERVGDYRVRVLEICLRVADFVIPRCLPAAENGPFSATARLEWRSAHPS
jgi:hypothetical protein